MSRHTARSPNASLRTYVSHTDVPLFVSTSETFSFVSLCSHLFYQHAFLTELVYLLFLFRVVSWEISSSPQFICQFWLFFFFTFYLIFLFKHGAWLL